MKGVFKWTEDRIDFFKDASEYTGFHRKLAEILKPYFKPEQTLCDIGCGLGFIDFQLAPYVKSIDAVDISELAIADYKKRLAESDIDNIKVHVRDANDLGGEKWNLVLSSFYGGPAEDIDNMLTLAEDLIIFITHVEKKHDKSSIRNQRPTTDFYEKILQEKGVKYEKVLVTMDFGQPFRDLESAEKYISTYVLEEDKAKKAEIINQRMKKIEATGDEIFPHFLSKEKQIGIFFIRP